MFGREIGGVSVGGGRETYLFDGVVRGYFSEKLTLEKWPEDHAGVVRGCQKKKCWQRQQLVQGPWCACPKCFTALQIKKGRATNRTKETSHTCCLIFIQFYTRFFMCSEFATPWRMRRNGVYRYQCTFCFYLPGHRPVGEILANILGYTSKFGMLLFILETNKKILTSPDPLGIINT